mmetsp:Transcript_43744/g.88469  ORF Transcript_43744/g.88469 Transcript_43744/m.88469 type:complete len:496 (-) Transcript_43744:245-1732(-)
MTKDNKKRPPPSTGWRSMNACFVLPAVVLVFLRGGDCFFYDEGLCAMVGPGAVLAGTVFWAAAMVHSSSRNPVKATMMGAGMFAAVKQRADSVPPPAVNSGSNLPLVTLVTGANSGIGEAVSLELARQGNVVFMACRSKDRCEESKASLVDKVLAEATANKKWKGGAAEYRTYLEANVVAIGGMDLSNTKSMADFAKGPVATAAKGMALDLLVLNAGFIPSGNSTSPAAGGGWEAGLGAMHLGHFAFVQTLSEVGLVTGPVASKGGSGGGGTVAIVVSSDLSRFGGFHESILKKTGDDGGGGGGDASSADGEGDLRGEVTNALWSLGPWRVVLASGVRNPYWGLPDGVSFGSYARAKLANVLFARELERRQVVGAAVSVHPGTVYTKIVELDGVVGSAQRFISPFFLRSSAAAANVVLSAAYGPSGVLKKNLTRTSASPDSGSAEKEEAVDPWLHYANGRGEVLSPSALAFKSTKLNDELARALWFTSERAMATA